MVTMKKSNFCVPRSRNPMENRMPVGKKIPLVKIKSNQSIRIHVESSHVAYGQ